MIKSRMQTDGFSAKDGQKYKSTLDCVRTVWRTEGLPAFTRGLGPTLIRYASEFPSVPVPAPAPAISVRRLGSHTDGRPADAAPVPVPFHSHRSPFANGATFLGFELASRLLDKI